MKLKLFIFSVHKGPVLAAVKKYSDKNMFYDESSLPNWIKNVAKLLQSGQNYSIKDKDNKESQIFTIQNENDWRNNFKIYNSKLFFFTNSLNE